VISSSASGSIKSLPAPLLLTKVESSCVIGWSCFACWGERLRAKLSCDEATARNSARAAVGWVNWTLLLETIVAGKLDAAVCRDGDTVDAAISAGLGIEVLACSNGGLWLGEWRNNAEFCGTWPMEATGMTVLDLYVCGGEGVAATRASGSNCTNDGLVARADWLVRSARALVSSGDGTRGEEAE
jgi:hypothetical protein